MSLARPKLIYLVTEDWYFLSHRLPAAAAAAAEGFEVAVATRIGRHDAAIEALGYRVLPLAWRRGALGPLATARAFWEIVRLYRRERPAIVHHIALKPAVLGGLAALLAGVPAIITTLAGLGTALAPGGITAALGRRLVKAILRLVELFRSAAVTTQNDFDRQVLVDGWPRVRTVVLIPGSGVDLQHFRPLPLPPGPLVCAQASRMLVNKGVEDLVQAVRALRRRGIDIRLLLAGAPDVESRAAIARERLDEWAGEPGIEWLGHVEDIREIWARAHIAVLASWGGEGIPKSLLEAAACGRPLIATDVPGCRDVVRAGTNGLLVAPRAPDQLAAALEELAVDRQRLADLAAAARPLVAESFGAEEISRQTGRLYRALLDGAAPAGATPAAQPSADL